MLSAVTMISIGSAANGSPFVDLPSGVPMGLGIPEVIEDYFSIFCPAAAVSSFAKRFASRFFR